MGLYDAKAQNKQSEKTRKLKRMIVTSIIILIIIIAILIGLMIYISMGPKKLSLQLDGKENNELLKLLDVEIDEKGTLNIYAPIKLVASYFGYEANNGSYPTASESTDICNIRNEHEVEIFTLNSNEITKVDLLSKSSSYEKIEMKKCLKKMNNYIRLKKDWSKHSI